MNKILCSICTEMFTGLGNERIYSTVCGHVFHYNCILKWFEGSKTCPTCRHEQKPGELVRLNLHIEVNVVNVTELMENCRIATEQNEELRLENLILKDENASLKNKLEARSYESEEDDSKTKDADKSRSEMKEVILSSAVDRITELERKVMELEQENDRLREMYFN